MLAQPLHPKVHKLPPSSLSFSICVRASEPLARKETPLQATPTQSDLRRAPLSFSLTRFVSTDEMSDKDILTGEIYRRIAKELALRLMESQLQDALKGGLDARLGPPTLAHYDPFGRFNLAICRLTLANLGPRLLVTTWFYLETRLVTTVTQDGVLDFSDLSASVSPLWNSLKPQ